MAPWLITLLIIGINGFFVAAEFALVKVRGSQVDVLVKQGSSRAKLIKHVVEHLDNYLSACQLGITIASLALWWVAEPLIASQFVKLNTTMGRWFDSSVIHAVSVPVTFFLITTLHIVIGEQAPKSFAIRDPLQTAQWIIIPLHWFYKIFRPFIWFLNMLSLGCLRLFGIYEKAEEQSHSEEELRMIVAESEEDGHINASERELIQNVFDFDDRQVSEIMTPAHKIFAWSINKRNYDNLPCLFQEWYSRVPLYDGSINNVVGWVLLKDLIQQYITEQEKIDIHKLIRPIQFVPENMKISDCLKFLQQTQIHIAMVTDEYGTTIGLVTMEDILEELVGDIHDEGDEQHTIVQNSTEGIFIIDATATIADINEHLPLALPEDPSYETMAWYVNVLFGRIPGLNETVELEWYTITVTKRKKQRVEQVKIIIKPQM